MHWYVHMYVQKSIHACNYNKKTRRFNIYIYTLFHPDIDGCSDRTDNCSQKCINTNGGFICGCITLGFGKYTNYNTLLVLYQIYNHLIETRYQLSKYRSLKEKHCVWVSTETPTLKLNSAVYKLMGIVTYQAHAEHYTSFVQATEDNTQWFYVNDK